MPFFEIRLIGHKMEARAYYAETAVEAEDEAAAEALALQKANNGYLSWQEDFSAYHRDPADIEQVSVEDIFEVDEIDPN